MAFVSEIIRFILPKSQANATTFAHLRKAVASKGSAVDQYFGYVLKNEGTPAHRLDNQICWYIKWPKDSGYRESEEFKSELFKLAESKPRSLIFHFTETKKGEVVRGLESSCCELAIIDLIASAPRFEPIFEESMHKTFTDCYFAKGFTGGGWGYALNGDNADGAEFDSNERVLEEKDRRLAYYIIGWKSIADHKAFSQTDLFSEELIKIGFSNFGPGTGAFWVKFKKDD